MYTRKGKNKYVELGDNVEEEEGLSPIASLTTDNDYLVESNSIFTLTDIGFTGSAKTRKFLIPDNSRTLGESSLKWGEYLIDAFYRGKNSESNLTIENFAQGINVVIPKRGEMQGDSWISFPAYDWHNSYGNTLRFNLDYSYSSSTNTTSDWYLSHPNYELWLSWDSVNKQSNIYCYNNYVETVVEEKHGKNPTIILDIQAGGGGGGNSFGNKKELLDDNWSAGGGGGGAGAFLSIGIDLREVDKIIIYHNISITGNGEGGKKENSSGSNGCNIILKIIKKGLDEIQIDIEGGYGGTSGTEGQGPGGNGGRIEVSGGIPNIESLLSGNAAHVFYGVIKQNATYSTIGGLPGGAGGLAGDRGQLSADTMTQQNLSISGAFPLKSQTIAISASNPYESGTVYSGQADGGFGGPSMMGHPGTRTENAPTPSDAIGYGYGGAGGRRGGYADNGDDPQDNGQDGGKALIILYY